MKVVISLCTFAAAVLGAAGAPALPNVFIPDPSAIMYNGQQLPYFRDRRSAYGAAYASPCGAQLPLAPAGGYLSPVHSSYGYGGGHASYGGHAGYGGAVASYGYGAPHYRSEEGGETEILNFSDMDQGMTEHMPMARYGGYGAPAGHAGGYGGLLSSAVATGPAVGVFPNANVGGCNVPLLLSCSPSIVPGRLVKSSGYGGGYGSGAVVAAGGNSYRGVDDQAHQDVHEEHAEEMTGHDSMEHVSDSEHTETHQ